MPLDPSRRLLSAGSRYTQLPPVPEDDHLTASTTPRPRSSSVTSAASQRPAYTNGVQQHSSSSLLNGDTHDSYTRNGFKTTNSFSDSNRNGSALSNGTGLGSSGYLGGGTSERSLYRTITSSSLVHTDGAVVPQAQPHHAVIPFTNSMLQTEVRLNQGKTCVRTFSHQPQTSLPIRPDRRVSRKGSSSPNSTLRSPTLISRPCMKNKDVIINADFPEPPVRPPRSRRGYRGGALLRAVTSRPGRGYRYEHLDGSRDSSDGLSSPPPSEESSCTPSPPYTPPPRSPHPSILVNSGTAAARQGIKRLARVSFGSSKGSMVETLIYDTATIAQDKIPEENGTTNDVITDPTALKYGTEVGAPQRPASKVRVSFFQSERPLIVTSPEPTSSELDSPCSSSLLLLDSPALLSSYPTSSLLSMMTSPSSSAAHVHLDRQLSSESGRDNPFRPDGDISREADEIVQLIKSGKPLAEATALAADSPMADDSGQVDEPLLQDSLATNQQAGVSPPSSPQHSAPLNGSSAPTPPSSAAAATITASPATVEVTHTTIPPSQPAVAPEHVVLKKKSKCGACCVIQ